MLFATSGSRLRPRLSFPDFPSDCHARLAALLVRGSSRLGFLGLGADLLPLLSDLKVWSMVRPFSGLGLLEDFFDGGANEEEAEGVGVLEDDAYAD